jgi:cytidine deaminase
MTTFDETLQTTARNAARNAHAPYSGLHVGAAIRAVSGAVYAGCNVENAAFPLGNCAEASAIAAGVQAEGPKFRIAAVAVHAEDRSGQRHAVSPCGGCRQRISEFARDDQVPVQFPWRDGGITTLTLAELLPCSFVLPGGSGR